MKIIFNKKTSKVSLGYTDELPVNDEHGVVCGLSFVKVKSGILCRPSNGIGSCGFYPFPWDGAIGKSYTNAASIFLRQNKKSIKNTLRTDKAGIESV